MTAKAYEALPMTSSAVESPGLPSEAPVTRMQEMVRGAPVLLVLALGAAFGIGGLPIFTMPLFIGPLREAYGWSKAEIGFAYTIITVVIFLGSPLVGRLADKIGARRVALWSMGLLTLAMFLMTLSNGAIVWFYANYFLIAVFGIGTTYVCYSRVLSTWFLRSRGLALGLMMSGPGLIAAVAPLVLSDVIATQGWRSAWTMMAVATAALWPLAWLLLKDGPYLRVQMRSADGVRAEIAGVPFSQIRRNRRFWLMLCAVFCVTLGTSGVHLHIVAISRELGQSIAQATASASLIGVSMLGGRLLSGLLLDRLFAPLVGFTLTMAAASAVLAASVFGASPVVMSVGIGLVFGMESDFMAYVVNRYFGLRAYSETFGWVYGFMALGSACSPVWVGWLSAGSAGYGRILMISAALLTVSATCIACLGRYPRPFDGVVTDPSS